MANRLTSVDSVSLQLPEDVREKIAENLTDPEAVEGAALSAKYAPLEDRTVTPGLAGVSLGTWTPRERIPVGSSQEVRAADTGSTVDHVAHLFQTVVKGGWDPDTGPNPGYVWGTNFFTVTGTQAGDGDGIVHLYGGLIEADVAAPAGTTIARVTGLQAEASFFGPASGAEVTDMASLFVASPERKDGATGGTVTNRVYGLLVEEVPANALGSTQAYSLYVEGGDSRVVGRFLADRGVLLRKATAGNTPFPAPPYLALYAKEGDSRIYYNDGDTSQVFILARENTVPAETGTYFYTNSPGGVGAVATLGVGNLRLAPMVITQPTTLSQLGVDISVAGEAGAKYRMGIYADSNGYPGALLVDTGQVAADSAAIVYGTASVTLQPGLYWAGGVVQNVTTTQPTVRIASNWTPPVNIRLNSAPAANSTAVGFSVTGVTGALPATFTAGNGNSGTVPRLIAHVA